MNSNRLYEHDNSENNIKSIIKRSNTFNIKLLYKKVNNYIVY